MDAIVTVTDCVGRPIRTRDLSLGRRVRYQFTKEGKLVGKASTYTACSTSLCYNYIDIAERGGGYPENVTQ